MAVEGTYGDLLKSLGSSSAYGRYEIRVDSGPGNALSLKNRGKWLGRLVCLVEDNFPSVVYKQKQRSLLAHSGFKVALQAERLRLQKKQEEWLKNSGAENSGSTRADMIKQIDLSIASCDKRKKSGIPLRVRHVKPLLDYLRTNSMPEADEKPKLHSQKLNVIDETDETDAADEEIAQLTASITETTETNLENSDNDIRPESSNKLEKSEVTGEYSVTPEQQYGSAVILHCTQFIMQHNVEVVQDFLDDNVGECNSVKVLTGKLVEQRKKISNEDGVTWRDNAVDTANKVRNTIMELPVRNSNILEANEVRETALNRLVEVESKAAKVESVPTRPKRKTSKNLLIFKSKAPSQTQADLSQVIRKHSETELLPQQSNMEKKFANKDEIMATYYDDDSTPNEGELHAFTNAAQQHMSGSSDATVNLNTDEASKMFDEYTHAIEFFFYSDGASVDIIEKGKFELFKDFALSSTCTNYLETKGDAYK